MTHRKRAYAVIAIIGLGAGGPIDRVLQRCGDGAVVFGRGDEKAVAGAEECLEIFRTLGQAAGVFDVLVEQEPIWAIR